MARKFKVEKAVLFIKQISSSFLLVFSSIFSSS